MHSIRGWADWQPSISTIDSHLHQRHVSWSGEFNLWWFVSHNAGDITISRWLESRMLLKTESDVEGFFPLPSISFPSLSLALSHKSHLPNSCLRSEIILRLFFTVAAQRWICKRFFFFPVCARACVCKVCLLSNKPAVSERSVVWREMLGEEVARWDWVLNILQGGIGVRRWGALPAPASSAGSSNNGRLPHLSQREHIYISSPRGTLRDEVSSNWIWISLHQG